MTKSHGCREPGAGAQGRPVAQLRRARFRLLDCLHHRFGRGFRAQLRRRTGAGRAAVRAPRPRAPPAPRWGSAVRLGLRRPPAVRSPSSAARGRSGPPGGRKRETPRTLPGGLVAGRLGPVKRESGLPSKAGISPLLRQGSLARAAKRHCTQGRPAYGLPRAVAGRGSAICGRRGNVLERHNRGCRRFAVGIDVGRPVRNGILRQGGNVAGKRSLAGIARG